MLKTKEKIDKFIKSNNLGLISDKYEHYIFKEKTTFVYAIINEDSAGEWVMFYSLVVKKPKFKKKLLLELLKFNSSIPFGAFGLEGDYIIFKHCILGGDHMDEKEFLQSLISVSKISSQYDDEIIKNYGGKTAMDIVNEELFK